MNFIRSLDKDLLKKLGIVMGAIVILFIILIIFMIIQGGKLSYNQIEEKMISSAKNYYNDFPDQLPQTNNGVVTISSDKLVELKYMKDLSKLVKNKSDVCSGQVSVTKNDETYLYSSTLNCGDNYKTKKLKDVLVEKVVDNDNGIYKIGEDYVFRGDNVDNYVSFADKIWRVLRVNSDGTIRLIDTTRRDSVVWDDRYNSDKEYNIGINDYNVSRIKDTLESIYDEFTDIDKAYMVKQRLCIGKRDEDSEDNSGNIECSNVVENQNIGLINVYEFPIASLSNACKKPSDPECTNYNYLADMTSTWTLNADSKTSYKVFKMSGEVFITNASNSSSIKPVIVINSQVNYVDGDGTEENPYTFK